jgi:putative ABC transport system permease protein
VIHLSGRFRSALIIGGQGIRARKLRTLLSMLSLFLGVLAVVVVEAGAETARQAALTDLELTAGKDGTVVMWVPPDARILPGALDTVAGKPDVVAMLSTRAVIGEPDVTPINEGGAPFDQPGNGIAYGPPRGDIIVQCDQRGVCQKVQLGAGPQPTKGQAIELTLVGLTGDIRQFKPFRPVSGQWLDFSGDPRLSPGLILNKEAAKGFDRYRVPAQMHLDGASADPTPRILGVVDDGNQQPVAYVRADELLNWLPSAQLDGNGVGGLQLMMTPQAAPAIEQTLGARAAAIGVPADEFHTETIHSKQEVESRLALLNMIFLGLASMVLLIGVAGILNVGLATVGERVEEFALRRAVGTPRSLLAGIVLAETMLTGLFTAGAAIGASALALKVLSRLLASHTSYLTHLSFPWQAGVAGVIAGLVAGLLGGLIPAVRAARIPIATVMRA